MPLIRYRTPDVAAILAEPCPCGRTMRRIRRDRSARATRCSSSRARASSPRRSRPPCLAVQGSLPDYQIVLSQEKGVDRVEVRIEVTAQIFSDQVGAMESLQTRLAAEIENTVGLRVPVRLVEPHAVDRSRGQGPARRRPAPDTQTDLNTVSRSREKP